MFNLLNRQGVQSDKEFIVQFLDRFEVEYKEGQKMISIYVEPGYTANKKFCLSIDENAFNVWADGTPISVAKQKEILKNFTEAMEFHGIGVIVE